MLSHLRHRNVARVLFLCGPRNSTNESLVSWEAARGYDFTFVQELAEGVPINRKSAPSESREAQSGESRVDRASLDNIDLAIELVEVLVSLHSSPIGAVAHGDLKWSNIITHPTQPELTLIDFDNAVIFPSLTHSMPASPIAFCCDMGKVGNVVESKTQKIVA